MNFPVDLTFKKLALASQIYVRDANGNLIGYVKQKLFKLKEDINVFADDSQTAVLYNIKADRIIDFSAKYTFRDGSGNVIGSIKRQGRRSIWKANYEITDAHDQHIMNINEENAWTKVFNAVAGEIPVLGAFTGYFFNPAYILSRLDGAPLARLAKQPAFFEGKFQLTSEGQMSPAEEVQVLLSFLMMALLERGRG